MVMLLCSKSITIHSYPALANISAIDSFGRLIQVPIDKLLAIGIKTKKEDINYFLPTYICEAERLSEYGENPIILTEDMEVK